MSGRERKIDGLLELAQNLEESVFQRKTQYLKFKSKRSLQRKDIVQILDGTRNYKGLKDLKFFEETVFWYKKWLNVCVCDQVDRHHIFFTLANFCHAMDKSEMFLEYAQKTLEVDNAMTDNSRKLDFGSLFKLTDLMVINSRQLEKPYAFTLKYLKTK